MKKIFEFSLILVVLVVLSVMVIWNFVLINMRSPDRLPWNDREYTVTITGKDTVSTLGGKYVG